MGIARRLYLYAAAAGSLLVLGAGLYNLVGAVLGEFADMFGAGLISGGDIGREQISLAIALVVVGAPLFAIHWWLIERGWRASDDGGLEDRRSSIRAFHMGLVATVALTLSTIASLDLIDTVLGAVLRGFSGSAQPTDGSGLPTDQIALLVIVLPIWWFHHWRRNADIRHDQLRNGAAWITRFHRYLWLLIGLMVLVLGASQLIGSVATVLVERQDFGAGSDWWIGQVSWAIAAMLVGSGLFAVHASDARRAIRDAAVIGEDDRSTALRAAYFGAVILITLSFTAVTVASALAEVLRAVLGVGEATSVAEFLELAVGPLLVAIPFAVAGWLHWSYQRVEARGLSAEEGAGAERLALHLAALVGLAFLAVGVAQLLARVVELVIGAGAADNLLSNEIAWFASQIVVGGILWLPAWTAILARRARNPTSERQATAGRAYLFLVVGAALLAGVPSAAFTLYKLIDTLLGGRGIALGSDLAIPVAVVLVAGVAAAYHGRLLVGDLRYVATTAAASVDPAPAVESVAAEPVAVGPPTTVALTLHVPGGLDPEAIVESVRASLPPGVVLERPNA